MIDAFSIIVSCLALAFVIRRAIKLDRSLPWFKPAPTEKVAEPVGSFSTSHSRPGLRG